MIDDETGEIRLDLSGAISQIYSVWAEDADLGGIQLKEFLMALDAKGLRDNLSAEELRLISDAISNTSPEFAEVFVETNNVNLSGESKNYDLNYIGFAGDDSLTGGNGNDRLSGDEGNDHISGNGGDDTLNGGSGDDRLFGGDGSDVMRGGQGDDILDGGKGDDKYIWNAGDGNDLISDGEGENTLEIGEGIDPMKVKIAREGDNLVIQTDDKDKGSVTAVDWYKGSNFGVNEISFADGTKWNREDIDAIASGLREPFSVADDELALFGASDQATDWASDPTLAAIMGEKQISTASSFAAEQMRMDIAVALLGFGSQEKEQVFDFMGSAAVDKGQVGLASGNSGDYFGKDLNNK
jgi:Ca2+-binding RTX toxin-like protein